MIDIPEDELSWTFARSGGPGGQNVNKVASKATLAWHFAPSPLLAEPVKERLARLFPRYVTEGGWLQISSQKYRDQERNRQDCLDKLQQAIALAQHEPKTRRPTRPTRGSHKRRLSDKKRRGAVKANRRRPQED